MEKLMGSKTSLRTAIDEEFLKEVQINEDLMELREYLKRYKELGVSAEEMMEYLVSLRDSCVAEAFEDKLLELMDIVSGFCSPSLRVW
ncbi:hypothetical protein ABL849_19925 [Variovorax sp. 375MFSha3.1]|uniref:Uncharacterized protein n=1 Tax=Variovorax guangxiensis TaxID=1775474 RepID=A0A840FUG9_9BURK|nr:hypothetical protein [Variovorax guangxiensis]MBB4220911.1 hypothetical protein [Variovorax guangxiensis]